MSKFMKTLQGIRSGGPRLGFAARPEQATPGLALAVVAAPSQQDLAVAAAGAGADAIVLALDATAASDDLDAAKRFAGALGGKPCGVELRDVPPDSSFDAGAWQQAGVDFLLLSTGQPAVLLVGDIGRVARIGLDFEPTDVRALDALAIDAFVVVPPEGSAGAHLTVADAAGYRLLTSLTRKPVLAGTAGTVAASDLEVLLQAGVDGVIVPASALGADAGAVKAAVQALRSEMADLRSRRTPARRGLDAEPIIPRVAPPPGDR